MIASKPECGRGPWGLPTEPAHSAVWMGRSVGGPQRDGGVGPNSTTDGVQDVFETKQVEKTLE